MQGKIQVSPLQEIIAKLQAKQYRKQRRNQLSIHPMRFRPWRQALVLLKYWSGGVLGEKIGYWVFWSIELGFWNYDLLGLWIVSFIKPNTPLLHHSIAPFFPFTLPYYLQTYPSPFYSIPGKCHDWIRHPCVYRYMPQQCSRTLHRHEFSDNGNR